MTAAAAANSLAFERRADRRVVLGVAGGFADQHGLDAIVVRAALLMLTFAGGLGIVVYVLGHVHVTSPQELREALDGALASHNATILEVRTERAENVALHRRVWEAVAGSVRTGA